MSWVESKPEWGEFLSMLAPGPGEKILDVGAGRGSVAAKVLESSRGAQVYAVDPNKKRVSQMAANFPAIRSSVAGAEELPFPDSNFDKAYTTMALHHYADVDRGLTEVARVLKKGGGFVILEMEPGSLMGRMFRFFGSLSGEHMTVMKEEQLIAKLRAHGELEVTKTSRLGPKYLVQLRRI